MVCCVQVTQLVEFLIDHREELFEQEVAGMLVEELPALSLEEETSEVCKGHKLHDNKSLLPQKLGQLLQGRARPSTNLQLCKRAEEGQGRMAIALSAVMPPRGLTELSNPIQGIYLSAFR